MISRLRSFMLIGGSLLLGIGVLIVIRQAPSKTALTAISNTPPQVSALNPKDDSRVSSVFNPVGINTEQGELSNVPKGSINGGVVDVNGLPVVGIYVSIESNENADARESFEVESQQGGTFDLDGLSEGIYYLQVRTPFETRPIDVTGNEVKLAAGEQRKGIRLICGFDASVKFSGRVVDSVNAPIQGAA